MYPSNNSQNQDDSNIPDYLRTSGAAAYAENASAGIPREDPNAAANLIRQKLEAIYAAEPNAQQEAAEVAAIQAPLSRHQLYMRQLQQSGMSLNEIQNAWHAYYQGLHDIEKHEVWREFYAANQAATPFQRHVYQQDQSRAATTPGSMHPVQSPVAPVSQSFQQPASFSNDIPVAPAIKPSYPVGLPSDAGADSVPSHASSFTGAVIPATYTTHDSGSRKSSPEKLSLTEIKQKIRSTVSAGGSLNKSDHLKSLGFGIATGALVVFIFLFGFFNELFITPFIQPSRQANDTPIIVNTASAPVGNTPKVIIPKINVEIPVDYSQTTTDETSIEAALDKGIVHYPTTVMPGQTGNAAFFGHSSNNIFNPGKYKFAFVLLHKLVEGDTFYLTYNGKNYAYQVISRRVVEPTEVSVLGPVPNETATATLITCDPPGTSLKRLVVVGRQISPDPGGNIEPGGTNPLLATTTPAADLPGNGPTLWSRLWNSIF